MAAVVDGRPLGAQPLRQGHPEGHEVFDVLKGGGRDGFLNVDGRGTAHLGSLTGRETEGAEKIRPNPVECRWFDPLSPLEIDPPFSGFEELILGVSNGDLHTGSGARDGRTQLYDASGKTVNDGRQDGGILLAS